MLYIIFSLQANCIYVTLKSCRLYLIISIALKHIIMFLDIQYPFWVFYFLLSYIPVLLFLKEREIVHILIKSYHFLQFFCCFLNSLSVIAIYHKNETLAGKVLINVARQ